MAKEVYLVTYNGYLNNYGNLVYTAGVYTSEEKAQKALEKLRKKLVETIRDPEIYTYIGEKEAAKRGKITPILLDEECIPEFKWWDENEKEYDSFCEPTEAYDSLYLGGYSE